MTSYRVTIHVASLEEAQVVQELALEAFGYPVTIYNEEPNKNRHPASQWRSGRIVLKHMRARPDRTYNSDQLAAELEEYFLSPENIRKLMSELKKEGIVYAVDRGMWRLTKAD